MDYYSAIYSFRGIGVVLEWPKIPTFSFITIKSIEIKHLFAKFFGLCADTWTINSEWKWELRIFKSCFLVKLKVFSSGFLNKVAVLHIFYPYCAESFYELRIHTVIAQFLSAQKYFSSEFFKKVIILFSHWALVSPWCLWWSLLCQRHAWQGPL